MEQIFKMQSVTKKVDTEKRQVTSVISTETPDRDNDIIELKGWDLKNYKKNPVVLWGHNYSRPPIAKTIKIIKDASKGELIATRQYPDEGLYPFADTIFNLVEGGYQRTVSVGFNPSKWERRDQLAESHRHYVQGDPESYYSSAGILFQKHELLEYSDVPVPANPEALNLAFAKGLMDKKTFEELNKIPCYKCPVAAKGLCTPDKGCMEIIKEACDSGSNINTSFKGWSNDNECEIVEVDNGEKNEMKWDREAALKNLKLYCGFTGDKKEVDLETYRKAFAWCVKGHLDREVTSKDFKLLHHSIDVTNELQVSKEAVKTALEVMADQRSKHIPADDRIEVYSHLSEHAEELGLEYPNFEELQKTFGGSEAKDTEEKLGEKIKDLARKLCMEDNTAEEVLTKAYDAITMKATVVKFASLEPAVVALEADFESISLEGKTIDDQHKSLFKRLVDIVAIVTEKNLTGHTESSEDSTEQPTEDEAADKNADSDFVDRIDKAFSDVEDSRIVVDPIEEGVEEVLKRLREDNKAEVELDNLFNV